VPLVGVNEIDTKKYKRNAQSISDILHETSSSSCSLDDDKTNDDDDVRTQAEFC
jgi:hypothetical protein